jgi:hypothetical protein
MPNSFARRCAICAALLLPALGHAQTALQEGLWEVAVQMDVGGAPTSDAPLVTRQCITQQTAQDLINQLAGTAGGCQIANLEQNGNEASWVMSCTGSVKVDGTGRLMLTSTGFQGMMDAWVTISDRRVPVHQTFSAQRVGDCQ